MRRPIADLLTDPFGERRALPYRRSLRLLGVRFELESDNAALLRIADAAFAGLPAHALGPRDATPTIRLALRASAGQRRRRAPFAADTVPQSSSPPAPLSLSLSSGAGLITATLGDGGRALLAPQLRAGLVAVDRALLRHAYHVRYELLEFAAYTLAARVRGLVPLHAACVASRGRAALILGDSGAGKSTLAACCLLDGLELLAEDSVLVEPAALRATGLASFLHLHADSLPLLGGAAKRLARTRARAITRRSGITKLELDLRRGAFKLARRPQRIVALIFVTPTPAAQAALLVPIKHAAARARLAAAQPYAAGQAGWPAFLRRIAGVPAYELHRGASVGAGSDAVRRLLQCASR